jgi:hypothetical protein
MGKKHEIRLSVDNLWNGCMLASIAHAIMVAHYPELSHEQSWDGTNYSVQNSAGTRGGVTFKNEHCVAAFRNDNSERLNNTVGHTDASNYFEGANSEILLLAESDTLQYLLDCVDGEVKPVVTTAFWGHAGSLFSIDTSSEMLKNGGNLLARQMMDVGSAINSWKEYYGMTEKLVLLLKSIYAQKIENPEELIRLSEMEIDMIGIADEDGLNECKTSFEEINIKWI